MMSAPSAASLTACARPCPRAAPVMKATCPSRAPMSVNQCALGGITGRDGGEHLDVRRTVEMRTDFTEQSGDRRRGAVGLERVAVGPLLDEDERVLTFVQRVKVAAGLLVDRRDRTGGGLANGVHRFG